MARRLLQHKGANLRGLETAISHRLAAVVDLQWPSKRWPIHVFTAGAMTCLATSTVCHLFSNFGFKNVQVSSPGCPAHWRPSQGPDRTLKPCC